jgi:hypothetical protein
MDTLSERDLIAFEEHYLVCARCLAVVAATERYVRTMQIAARRLRDENRKSTERPWEPFSTVDIDVVPRHLSGLHRPHRQPALGQLRLLSPEPDAARTRFAGCGSPSLRTPHTRHWSCCHCRQLRLAGHCQMCTSALLKTMRPLMLLNAASFMEASLAMQASLADFDVGYKPPF